MLFFPPFLYASTFYRFKYFFSYLKKRQPQVVADVPHRVNKNKSLPILVIFKNGDFYPSRVIKVEVYINKAAYHLKELNQQINTDYWERIEDIQIADFETGFHKIDIKITYKTKNKTYTCINDNYRSVSHNPFNCYFADTELPLLPGVIAGDMHSHSNFTNDQIEFGASIKAAKIMARPLGLNLFAVTDHSYDLDDMENNFLKNDPKLPKWNRFLKEVREINIENDIFIVPGEEVSVKNSSGQTVHLLVYNSPKFFKGSGDSGEKWFHYYSEYAISDVLANLPEGAISFAAHPADKIPALHKILLNRGQWHFKDAIDTNLTGVQIFNGQGKEGSYNATSFWVKLLLNGYKVFALAGNDAHGHFGKNKSISIPFARIRETDTHLFGQWRTDFFLNDEKLNIKNIIIALKRGNYSLSNGPCLDVHLLDKQSKGFRMGEVVSEAVTGNINFKSNDEFGVIKKLTIIFGDLNAKVEKDFKIIDYSKNIFSDSYTFKIENQIKNGYFRAEIQSEGPKGLHFSFSNPIWVV